MEAVLFIGIQAAGKSTFYNRNFFKTHIRINLDMLKTRNRESILVQACIEAKQPFVIDNTNPTVADRQKYIKIAKEAGFTITGYYFESKIAHALTRNSLRTGHECVPKAAILGTHAKLILPCLREGFDALYYVRTATDNAFIVDDFINEI